MTTYKSSITGTTPFADYRFRVRAVNQQGAGEWSAESAAAQFNYNKASGGSESVFTGTDGVRVRCHTWTSVGTFDFVVTAAPKVFRVGAVAGGYDSARFSPGARGRTTNSKSITLTPGTYKVKVGNRGGQESGLVGKLTISGSAGGAGDTIKDIFKSGNWQSGGAGGPCCGIPTGQGYAVGGGYSDNSLRSPGTHPGAGGGAGEAVDPVWQPGYRGIVAIAYEEPA